MEIGARLHTFTIVKLLGAGGMGQVYLAEDTQLRRHVAIKAVAGGDSPKERQRLLREARVAASLNHPNICTIHQVAEENGQVFIVMEHIDGRTLRDAIPPGGFDAEAVVRYGTQIADALAYAHENGVVHRDLKSSNVMITPKGRLKILDFGLAKHRPALGPDEATFQTGGSITGAREIIGTLHYMAPELLRGAVATPASDVWALGVVLYETVAGRLPFDATTSFELSAGILTGLPPQLPEAVPPELAAVIHRCLQKQSEHRYQHAAQVRSALERASTITPPADRAGARDTGSQAGISLATAAAPAALDSIAVLPLRNLSGDSSQEYFSDGLTETLINDLAQIRALKVISRTSVMRHKGSDRPLPEIARELNVKAIVEGSVLRLGDQVRVTAQLVDVASDTNLWAQSYTRSVGDIFALQSELARAIAHEVQVTVTPQERVKLATAAPVAAEVYETYLKGRHFWNMRTAEGFAKAVEWFQKAIALDANYPLPHAVLADTFLLFGVYGFRRPKDVFPPALKMVRRAIELDDTLAEAHSTLGWGIQLFDLDRVGAEREYRRALELNPGHVPTHLRYGAYLMGIRRTDEGLEMLKRGVELDPLSMIMRALLAYGYYLARQFDRAAELCQSTLDLDPNFWWTHWSLGETYRATGRPAEAVTHLERALALSPANAFIEGALGAACAASGQRERATELLAAMNERAARQYVAPYFIALIHLGLGERDRAFEWLATAVEERDSWIAFCAVNPALDELRADPRLSDITRRMKVDW